jgi:ankyrin repeat protein
MHASAYGHTFVVDQLLEAGADKKTNHNHNVNTLLKTSL